MGHRYDDPIYAVDQLLHSRVPELVRVTGRQSEQAFARELGFQPAHWSEARYEGRQITDVRVAAILIALMLQWRVISRIELHLAMARRCHAANQRELRQMQAALCSG